MKRFLITLIALITVLQFVQGCTKKQIDAKSMEQIYQENGVPVRVMKIERRPLSAELTFNAVLTGIKESTASAKVSDKVEKIHFKVGDSIKKDQVVISFPIDNPAAQYNQAKVSYEHAESTLKRMQNLYDSGGISLQDLENTKTQFQVAKANWEAAQQSVKVKAPISGTLTRVNVQETDNVAPGDKLFTISQTQKLKTRLWVSESQITEIHRGDAATAFWGGDELAGQVVQVDMSMNTKNQAFGVMVVFSNPDHLVKSGVNAEIKIQSGTNQQAVVIDRKNVVRQGNKSMVFIASDGKAIAKEIEVGKILGLDVEVVKGLTPGDLLIVEGQHLLKDGAKIRII